MRLKQLEVPDLLILLAEWDELVDLIGFAILEDALELLGQLQYDKLVDRVGFPANPDFIFRRVLFILIYQVHDSVDEKHVVAIWDLLGLIFIDLGNPFHLLDVLDLHFPDFHFQVV